MSVFHSWSWMVDVFGVNSQIKLRNIILPMTHDSATAALTKNTFSYKETGHDIDDTVTQFLFRKSLSVFQNILFRLTQTQITQDSNISFLTLQASIGVRAFDLRLYITPQHEVIFYHGTVVWNTIFLDALRDFNIRFRKGLHSIYEIFIFRMSHIKSNLTLANNLEIYITLLNGILDIFGNSLCSRGDFINAKLSELQDSPIIIIFDIPNATISGILKRKFKWLHISQECYDDDYQEVVKNKVNITENSVINYCNNRKNIPQPDTKIRELQMHFQIKAPDILTLIKAPNTINIQERTLSKNLNKLMIDLLHTTDLTVLPSFDFYDMEITYAIVEMNKKRLSLIKK